MFLHSTIATKFYSNMQINYSFWLTFISTMRDLYCAMEGQVCSAPSHVSLTRPDQSAFWSCSVPQREAQRAAMFSCRAAWQRCGPLARRAACRLPRNGKFRKAAFTRRRVQIVFSQCHLFDSHLWKRTPCPQVRSHMQSKSDRRFWRSFF